MAQFPARSVLAILIALHVAPPALAAGEGSGSSNPDLFALDVDDVSATRPREVSAPLFDIDWNVALRGTYKQESGGGSFGAVLAPDFTLTQEGQRTTLDITGSSEIMIDAAGAKRLGALRLGADSAYQLDTWTGTTASVDLALTQADPNDSSLPANTAIAPLVFEGESEVSVTRNLGAFAATLRGSLGRSVHGETTLADSSTIDNSADNDWRLGAGGRLGYAMTPLLTAFVDGGLEWQRFDAVSPSLLVYLDALTYSAKTGLSYTFNSTFSAEGAVGLAWRDYTDPGLTDAATVTADASLTLKPNDSLSLVASLDTSLAPSDSVPGDSVASSTAVASASYVISPWVTLRGNAGYTYDRIIGTGAIDTSATFGAGVDYNVTDHAALTLDYGFTRSDAPPAPVADSQSIAAGVRFSK